MRLVDLLKKTYKEEGLQHQRIQKIKQYRESREERHTIAYVLYSMSQSGTYSTTLHNLRMQTAFQQFTSLSSSDEQILRFLKTEGCKIEKLGNETIISWE